MTGTLLRGAALLVMLAFAVQGLSTSAKRLWAPSHYHLVMSEPATPVPAALAEADPPAGQAHDHGQGHATAHEHGDLQADAAAVAWAQANTAGSASRFNHSPAFDFDFDLDFSGNDRRAGRVADRFKDPGSAESDNAMHQHAAGSGHRHDATQRGVVYVDAGAGLPPPPTIAAGFEAYWSIVPPGRPHTLVRRPHAPPPRLTQLAQASRPDGPPERPPRA